MASLRERVARCQDELEARRPDGKLLGLLAAAEGATAPGGDAEALEELRQELKRKKFLYLAVEAQLRFVGGCRKSDLASLERSLHGRDLEEARREAKERNQALKRDVAQEAEEHARLCQQLSEAHREATRRHEECEAELRELARLVEEEDAEEAAVQREGLEALGALGAAGPLGGPWRREGEEDEAAGALLGLPGELAKRRRLEYEQRWLEQQRRVPRETRAELERLEARERREVERLEELARLEGELGLPNIAFDDARGVVVLGEGPGASDEDLALRTVRVEHDSAGRLARAEPHPSLCLWNEASASVEADDLARLLTLVWDRLCEQQGRGGPGPASELGGA